MEIESVISSSKTKATARMAWAALVRSFGRREAVSSILMILEQS